MRDRLVAWKFEWLSWCALVIVLARALVVLVTFQIHLPSKLRMLTMRGRGEETPLLVEKYHSGQHQWNQKSRAVVVSLNVALAFCYKPQWKPQHHDRGKAWWSGAYLDGAPIWTRGCGLETNNIGKIFSYPGVCPLLSCSLRTIFKLPYCS